MTKVIMALCASLLLSACGMTPTRPPVVKLTYEQVAGMSEDEFEAAKVDSSREHLADRYTWLEQEQFVRGDPVERKAGTLTMTAVFDPLLRVGHFTFVNDPRGLEGEITTNTYVVGVSERGIIIRDENNNGKIVQVLQNDLGRTADVGRLIISKAGDILAAYTNGALAAEITACDGDSCGGGAPVAFSYSGSSSGAMAGANAGAATTTATCPATGCVDTGL